MAMITGDGDDERRGDVDFSGADDYDNDDNDNIESREHCNDCVNSM